MFVCMAHLTAQPFTPTLLHSTAIDSITACLSACLSVWLPAQEEASACAHDACMYVRHIKRERHSTTALMACPNADSHVSKQGVCHVREGHDSRVWSDYCGWLLRTNSLKAISQL